MTEPNPLSELGHLGQESRQLLATRKALEVKRADLVAKLNQPPPPVNTAEDLINFFLKQEKKENQIAGIDRALEEIGRYEQEIRAKIEVAAAEMKSRWHELRQKELHQKIYGSLNNNDD